MSNLIENRFQHYEVNTLEELVANELFLAGLEFDGNLKVAIDCLGDKTMYFYQTIKGEDGKYRLSRGGKWAYGESEVEEN